MRLWPKRTAVIVYTYVRQILGGQSKWWEMQRGGNLALDLPPPPLPLKFTPRTQVGQRKANKLYPAFVMDSLPFFVFGPDLFFINGVGFS